MASVVRNAARASLATGAPRTHSLATIAHGGRPHNRGIGIIPIARLGGRRIDNLPCHRIRAVLAVRGTSQRRKEDPVELVRFPVADAAYRYPCAAYRCRYGAFSYVFSARPAVCPAAACSGVRPHLAAAQTGILEFPVYYRLKLEGICVLLLPLFGNLTLPMLR